MAKFERKEDGKFVCPECEREYEKYNSLYQHYNQKHGNSDNAEKVNRAVKSVTTKIKKIPETATKEITGSNSNEDIADDDNESREIVNNASKRIASVKRNIKRVRLKPVEPPVKNPQKATENENGEETETETWIIPGILKVSSKNKQKKQKLSQEDEDKKWVLIEGLL